MNGDSKNPLRFALRFLPGVVFARYPISTQPADGTVGFINTAQRQCGGIFKDGEWCDERGLAITWEPTHWTIMEDRHEQDR